MILLQINFDYPADKMGDVLTNEARELAESINNEKGFISKIWIENAQSAESGGIYMFEDMESAKAYATMHAERVKAMGATTMEVKYFNVNQTLSKINRAL